MMIKKGTFSEHDHVNEFSTRAGNHVVGVDVGDSRWRIITNMEQARYTC